MSERMFHTPLEPHPSSSMYPPLFSGHKSDRHKDPSQDRVVYEEEPKLGYCDAGWSLSSDSISNKSPSQARSRATLTLLDSNILAVGERKLSLGVIRVTQNNSGKWNHRSDYHHHPFLLLLCIPYWWSLGRSNILMHCWQVWKKRTDGFLPWLFFHSSWPSFQWNPHSPWTLLQEMHHLYFLLLRVMVDVVRSLVSETTGFLVTHSGSSLMDFLGLFPLEPFPVGL